MKNNITITNDELFAALQTIKGQKSWNETLEMLLSSHKEFLATKVSTNQMVKRVTSQNPKRDYTEIFFKILAEAKTTFPNKKIPKSFFLNHAEINDTAKRENLKIKSIIPNTICVMHLSIVNQLCELHNIDLATYAQTKQKTKIKI